MTEQEDEDGLIEENDAAAVGGPTAQINRRLKKLRGDLDYLGTSVATMALRHDEKVKMATGQTQPDEF